MARRGWSAVKHGLPRTEWRISAVSGAQGASREGPRKGRTSPRKRNGADLAVDPTLAGSWTPKGTWRPGVSMPVPRSSCEHSRSASIRPALAPAPAPSGAEIDREDQLPAARRFRDHHVDLGLIAASALPEGSAKSSAPDRQSGLSDVAPSRHQRSGIWIAPGRTFVRSASHSSTTRLSPSCLGGSKIPSSSPVFRPLSWKGQSPLR
jgi:hypothetical protein